MKNIRLTQLTIVFSGLLMSQFLVSDEAAEMAKKLANPIAALISVPI